MTTLYIYNIDTLEVIETIDGQSESDCLAQAEDLNLLGVDEFGATFTPAFGTVGGLVR